MLHLVCCRVMRLLLALTFFMSCSHALKFFVYLPMFGRSHVTFLGKLADALVDAGHEVVSSTFHVACEGLNHRESIHLQIALGPVVEAELKSYGTKKAEVIVVPQTERMHRLDTTSE